MDSPCIKQTVCKVLKIFQYGKYLVAYVLNYQNLLKLLWKSFLCRLFFQMIEINYVPIYMKINHIFFVIKGQFPVTDYIPNTIILYFIVHCIYVLCIFYCITTCLCLSLTPPVSGLRCIVFNKVLFCSVKRACTAIQWG